MALWIISSSYARNSSDNKNVAFKLLTLKQQKCMQLFLSYCIASTSFIIATNKATYAAN